MVVKCGDLMKIPIWNHLDSIKKSENVISHRVPRTELKRNGQHSYG